jgi:hypothetical protein
MQTNAIAQFIMEHALSVPLPGVPNASMMGKLTCALLVIRDLN